SGNVLGGRTVTWSSGAAGVATVSSQGLVTGVAGGSAQITATSEGKSGSATITVNASTATAVLVGAGDIVRSDHLSQAEATAKLLDNIPGTVIVIGDNAYD